jgi:hypothetical protein
VLWVKESASGTTFMSGSVTCPACTHDQRIVVFSTPKKSDKSPDYRILKSQPRDGSAPVTPSAPASRLVRPGGRDDMPF